MMVSAVVARIPVEWEKKYGDDALKEVRQEMTFVDDTNHVARLTALAAPLLRVLPSGGTDYKFYLVDDGDPNAFALPGGHILVTTGMLEMVRRPEELLGTVAHEVAHVTQKHSFREEISSGGPFLIFKLFFSGKRGTGSLAAAGSALVIARSFSQEYETEADEVGWRYLVAANIDPRGLTDALRGLQAYEAKHAGLDLTPQAFSSHPAMDKRIARLESKWNKLSRKTGFIELTPVPLLKR
jgi:predicted Zn-dependent protease